MDEKKEIAASKSLVNYNFFIGATHDNLQACLDVKNVPGIKMFVGSSTGNLLVDDEASLNAYFSSGNRLIAVHSEHEKWFKKIKKSTQILLDVKDFLNIRTVEAAVYETRRLVELSKKYQRRLHICHLTTYDEALFLKDRPSYITCEITAQHLLCFGPEIYDKWDTFAQINPPIRTRDHQEGLFKALQEGWINCMGSDHAPHSRAKAAAFSSRTIRYAGC